MARISKFGRLTRERHTVHDAVECGFVVFDGDDGNRYLQLDTFGSETRRLKGKVSQSLQLDKDAAGVLLDLIYEAFPEFRKPVA